MKNFMIRWLVRFFFNRWYKVKPPEMVQYWKNKDMARAKVFRGDDGALKMQIEGEKRAYPGFPRGHVLMGPLASLKSTIKNRIFNEVFAEISKMADEMKYDMIPPEKMAPAVRELWRVLEELENAEVVEDMKLRIKLIKKIITFFLQEDDAYRFRWQWVMQRLDMDKIKLTKEDLYYLRGKYFKPDIDKYDY